MQGPSSGTCSIALGETSGVGNRTADTVLKSSWIRRLKPRDEREGRAVETDNQNPDVAPSESLCSLGQGGELTSAEGGRGSVEEIGALKSSEFAGSLQEKASGKTNVSDGEKEKSNLKSGISSEASIHALKQNDDSADRQSKQKAAGSEGLARERATSRSGFGSWINVCAGSRLVEKPSISSEGAESNSKHVVDGFRRRSVPNSPVAMQSCKQHGERGNGISRSGPQTATIPPGSMGKPPLPPPRSGTSGRGKLGLLPKPISQKLDFLPFLSSIAAPSPSGKSTSMSDPDISHSSLLGHPLQTSTNREGMSIEGTSASFTVTKQIKECSPDGKIANVKALAGNCMENRSHPSVITATRLDHCGVRSESHESVLVGKAADFLSGQQSTLHSQQKTEQPSVTLPPSSVHIAKPWKSDKRESFEVMDAPLKGEGSVHVAKDATTLEFSSEAGGTDLHLHSARPENEQPEFDKCGEAASQTAVRELKGNSLQPSSSLRVAPVELSVSSHGAANIDKSNGVVLEPPCSASGTANFPWEMFVEAAGISRKAFVETYNRARAELKNQKTSHVTTTLPDKEMNDTKRLVSGQGTCGSDVPPHPRKPERQSLESHQPLVRYLQSEGKLTPMNGTSEREVSFSGIYAKVVNVHAQEQERAASKQQGVSLSEGKVRALHEKKAQTCWTTHRADGGRADPASETGPCVNAPAVLSVASALNTLDRSPGDHPCLSPNPTLSQGTDGFRKDPLLPLGSQSSVTPKAPPQRENHQNNSWKRNVDQRSDVVKHIPCKTQRTEGNMLSQSQGFLACTPAMNDGHPQKCLKAQGFSLSKGLSQVAVASDCARVQEHAAAQLLGKRPRAVFEAGVVVGTRAGIAGKRSAGGTERSSGRPHVWLERWHANYHNAKNMQGHAHVESNGVKQDSLGGFALSMVSSKNSDGCSLHDKTTETNKGLAQKVIFEKDRGFEYIPSHSEKVLPSAAAMAIVGTAARQFCAAQPQRKGCFALWSGFGLSKVQKSDIQKGKGKV